ncbi:MULTISPECIES: sulfite exporter TauE/SafE family protein [unclassified Gemella]|uniref:sulfite exporter TauE/SafE family protein n=1 Tax=unclassified Gemella TaxID=2624949 RepID=UPI0015D0A39C|nr:MULTISPECIES: sulfite exporter TauE/SafE family protein [unclassified Gemella]MBF0709988.1 sulfite exporter TauE/SafE family protein [Gemella sp. GL1.1]MBF0746263.1 sulfite exporter TauE/SafE family protein [Gemella sp. 19428wG2_WT2a]NYS27332.1 sulfite exporter TauE/SafE family protein [Gemella sp. GL1]
MDDIIILLIICMVAGLIGSLVGLGGGLIITPILTTFFDIDIKYAIGASILAVIATSSGASISFLKDKLTNVRIGLFLEIFTTLGALIGALLAGIFSSQILYLLFSFILMNSFYGMLKKEGIIKNKSSKRSLYTKDLYAEKLGFSSSYYDKSEKKEISYEVYNVKQGSLVMLGAGLASGLLGIGSGAFKIMALDGYMKLPIKVSTATSNFMMGVTASTSALIYFLNGTINPYIAAPVALGTLFGSMIGSRLMQILNAKYLRYIMLPIILFTIINMIMKGFGLI